MPYRVKLPWQKLICVFFCYDVVGVSVSHQVSLDSDLNFLTFSNENQSRGWYPAKNWWTVWPLAFLAFGVSQRRSHPPSPWSESRANSFYICAQMCSGRSVGLIFSGFFLPVHVLTHFIFCNLVRRNSFVVLSFLTSAHAPCAISLLMRIVCQRCSTFNSTTVHKYVQLLRL